MMWVGKRGVRFGLPVIRPQTGNLESFIRLNECQGDYALIENRFAVGAESCLWLVPLMLTIWPPARAVSNAAQGESQKDTIASF
jgi:hypothetical protein